MKQMLAKIRLLLASSLCLRTLFPLSFYKRWLQCKLQLLSMDLLDKLMLLVS